MREPVEREVNRDEVLKKAFTCLMENGLEKTSTRLLSEYTGLKTSSLYYWFKDKDELIVDATEFGLDLIAKKSLELAMQNKDDVSKFCKEFAVAFREYSKSLKLIIHVASSPTYSEIMIGKNGNLEKLYHDFTIKISNHLNVDYDKLRPLINLFVATVTNCAVWEQWEQFEEQVKYLTTKILDLKNVRSN